MSIAKGRTADTNLLIIEIKANLMNAQLFIIDSVERTARRAARILPLLPYARYPLQSRVLECNHTYEPR
jgi:hypothetical protein